MEMIENSDIWKLREELVMSRDALSSIGDADDTGSTKMNDACDGTIVHAVATLLHINEVSAVLQIAKWIDESAFIREMKKIFQYPLKEAQLMQVITKAKLISVIKVLDEFFPQEESKQMNLKWRDFNKDISWIKKYLRIKEDVMLSNDNIEEMLKKHSWEAYMKKKSPSNITIEKIERNLFSLRQEINRKPYQTDNKEIYVIKTIEESFKDAVNRYSGVSTTQQVKVEKLHNYSYVDPIERQREKEEYNKNSIARFIISFWEELKDVLMSEGFNIREDLEMMKKKLKTMSLFYKEYLSGDDESRIAENIKNIQDKIAGLGLLDSKIPNNPIKKVDPILLNKHWTLKEEFPFG